MTTDAMNTVKQKVLCVDDEVNILKSLRRLFITEPLELMAASSGAEALELMNHHQFDLIISDMRMPSMDGAEFLTRAYQIQPESYRILMTGYADIQSTIAAVNSGKISRYIAKPWNNQELIIAVQDGLKLVMLQKHNHALQQQVLEQNRQLKLLNQDLENRVELRTTQLKQILTQLKFSMKQVENQNQSLMKVLYNQINVNPLIDGQFALRLSYLCRNLARHMGLSPQQQEHLALAGMLSEIGLSGLPPTLLSKPTRTLDENEWLRYREHTRFAEEILSPATAMAPVAEIIRHQYEVFNGSGYPDQLNAEHIPLGSRILAVARDYYGYLNGRLLPRRIDANNALRMMRQQQGAIYDPLVLMALSEISAGAVPVETVRSPSLSGSLSLDQLQPGMKLKANVYNQKNMLLLPEGQILTEAVLTKLRRLLSGSHAELLFLVEQADVTVENQESP
jgi:response regulator RpfG family c-di-GMP phosphodiesterase